MVSVGVHIQLPSPTVCHPKAQYPLAFSWSEWNTDLQIPRLLSGVRSGRALSCERSHQWVTRQKTKQGGQGSITKTSCYHPVLPYKQGLRGTCRSGVSCELKRAWPSGRNAIPPATLLTGVLHEWRRGWIWSGLTFSITCLTLICTIGWGTSSKSVT